MPKYRAVANSAILAEDRLAILRRVAKKYRSSTVKVAGTSTKKAAAKKATTTAGNSATKKAPAKV